MSVPYFQQVLCSQQANGTLFNGYTTAKSVINATELVPMVGNYLRVGSKLRVSAWGGLSNIVTTPGTITFQIMMGSIVVWTSGALQLSTTANTLTPFGFQATIRLLTAGPSTAATFIGGGSVTGLDVQLGSGVANPTVSDSTLVVPAGAPAAGTGFDSTISNIFDFWVGFSISNSGNGVQLYDYSVEQLG